MQSSSHIGPERSGALQSARDDILGPIDERGPTAPVDGAGGTAMDRTGYGDPIESTARAYGLASSEQKARGVIGPSAATKVWRHWCISTCG